MDTQELLTKEEFILKFKYKHKLATQDEEIMATYESYCVTIRKLRSDAVKELRYAGVPGHIRARYNDYLQPLMNSSYIKYLYYKDPTCGICHKPIYKIEEVTKDHVIPTAKGGPNCIDNYQIAHGPCNVKKSDKIVV